MNYNIFTKQSFLGTISIDLNSEKFYDKLHHGEIKLSEYSSECTRLITAYEDTYKRTSLRRMCATLVKYLKTAYISVDRRNFAYNDCILLNYWVYTRLANIFGSDDASIIAGPFAILQQIWHDIVDSSSDNSRNNKCFPDGTLVTQKDWRERKALYDYCVNYDTIKKTIPSYEEICPEYWSYVDSHTSLFEYFKTRCSKTNDQCPEFYNNCKQYDPKEFLLTFSCNEQMKQKKADTLAKARQALQSSTADVQEQISRITGGSEVSAGGSLLTSDGSHPVEKTGNILLGVVATSLASGALYRFTPLGNMLRNGFGRNNHNMRNMHGGEYGLFDYAPESYNPFTGGGEEHYIGYHPA